MNLPGPQNAGCFFPTCVGLGYLRQIPLRGVVTPSSKRATVRHFTPLHECEKIHKTRVSRPKIFVIIFRSVQVIAHIPTEIKCGCTMPSFLACVASDQLSEITVQRNSVLTSALLGGFYAAQNGSLLTTFGDKLFVPST